MTVSGLPVPGAAAVPPGTGRQLSDAAAPSGRGSSLAGGPAGDRPRHADALGAEARHEEARHEEALDDETLVARARDGDPGAFERLVDRYQGPMYRLAVRMLEDRGEAEDVVQEVFLAAWRRLPEIREDAAFAGWLYRTTTNRCLNVLRARRPRAEEDLEQQQSTAPGDQPERAAETAAAVAALGVALRQLTPEQRAAWLLREVHGRSYAEIAAILGTSAAAVRGRIARSRAELAEVMAPWR